MPGKHVRFAEDNYALSPLALTPNSSYSLSPASSGGILTPPLIHHSIPLPYIPVQMYPLLACSPTGFAAPPLLYDVTQRPSTARSAHDLNPLPPHVLCLPATNPPQPHLTIICSNLPSWSITVVASDPHVGVTVQDLLQDIYHRLSKRRGEAEYRALPTPQAREMVSGAFKRRFRAAGDEIACEKEKAQGLKRVDFLMGRTRWMGLSSDKRGPDIWVLNVA